MSDFMVFKNAVNKQFTKMIELGLYQASATKDDLWDTYLGSFPEGTNPIFRTRTEHDCQCCKQFIRAAGNVVAIQQNEMVSIWDIDIGGHFQVVADALSALVKSTKVKDHFFHYEKHLGTDLNHQQGEDGKVITWNHFHYELPPTLVKKGARLAPMLNDLRGDKDVLKRGLDEMTLDAAETVLELIKQKSLYKGDEYKAIVQLFIKHKKAYIKVSQEQQDNYCWVTAKQMGNSARMRNNVIGTLICDISDNVELDKAVASFESKVAPSNYKRSSAVITKRMINMAQDKVVELGLTDSLPRRYAVTEDLTINNVIYADRSAKKAMNAFDELKEAIPETIKNLDKIEEVSIDTFIEDIVPTASTIELMLDNGHTGNLMSLVAPVNKDAKGMFKWDNNFSWTYNGEVTDSMKQRVKAAGGKVDGKLRFSIQWNDNDDNNSDLDAHCYEPSGNHIYYSNKKSSTSGTLDVDIQNPGNNVAVENITWSRVSDGEYKFLVHNYQAKGNNQSGFTAEIEFNGKIYSYNYPKPVANGRNIEVATIKILGDSLEFIKALPSTKASKEIWGVNTETFVKVNMVMHSPNHWDNLNIGNKHVFFMLDKCINPDAARGFYNEFLKDELHDNRKVFEMLGSKMKTEPCDNQLSGLGFSSTQRNSVLCKVTGSFSRIIKINF